MICPYIRNTKRIMLEPDGVDLMTEFVHEEFGECKGAECMAYDTGKDKEPRCRLMEKHKANTSDLA